MATITISRLEQYPADEPTGHCVGFTVNTTNGKSFYTDTVIPFTDADDDDKAVAAAYASLKDSIDGRITAIEAKSALLGQVFTPPVVEDAPAEEAVADAPVEDAAPPVVEDAPAEEAAADAPAEEAPAEEAPADAPGEEANSSAGSDN